MNAPHSPLVEKVAKAIHRQDRMVVTGIFDGKLEHDKVLSWEECKLHLPGAAQDAIDAAKAAIASCHVEEMRQALLSIAEYWSRDQNEQAMADACWHAINTAEAILCKIEER